MTDERKENTMVCTGGIPPQVIMGMEMYQAYWRLMADYWNLYMQAMRFMDMTAPNPVVKETTEESAQ